jgi:hypothetical protein
MADSPNDLVFQILTKYLGHDQAEAAYKDIVRLKVAIAAQIDATDQNISATQRDAAATAGALAIKREMTMQEKALAQARLEFEQLPPPKVFGMVAGADLPEQQIEQTTAAMEEQSAQATVSAENAALYEAEIARLTQEQAALEAAILGTSEANQVATAATAEATVAKEAHAAATADDTAATNANNAAAADSAFMGRKLVSLFDELSRGQRGALMGTFGSLLKTFGVGIPGMIAGMAALTALTFGIGELQRAFKKGGLDALLFGEDLDALAKAAANPDFLAGIQAKINILETAKGTADRYADAEQKVFEHEESITTALQEQLTLMAAIEQARGTASHAQKALALAKVALSEQEEQISHSQALQERTSIESFYEAEEFKRRQQAAQAEQAAKESAYSNAAQQLEQLDRQKKAADQRAVAANADYAAASKDFGKYDTPEKVHAVLKPLQDRAAEMAAQLKRMQGELGNLPPEKQAYELKPYQAEAARAQALLAGKEKEISFLQQHGGDTAKQNAESLAAIAKSIDSAAQQNLTALNALWADVQKWRSLLGATGPYGAEAESARQEQFGVQENTELQRQAGEDVRQYRAYEEKVASHKSVTDRDRQQALNVLKDLNDALAGHAEVLEYVKGLGVNVDRIAAAQAELKREMAQNHSQARSFLLP